MIDRMAIADDRAGDVAIPRGSTVIVFVYGAHHAPRYWQSPESFDPERFTKANEKLQPPFTYLPFGGGPRGCIGGNYAMLQILMILSVLLRRYDFQLSPGQTIEARPMVILRPKHGIRMTFTDRAVEAIDQSRPASEQSTSHSGDSGRGGSNGVGIDRGHISVEARSA
jgi:cytochrome P450